MVHEDWETDKSEWIWGFRCLRKDHDFVRAKTKSTENISKSWAKAEVLATSFCHPNHLNDFDVTTLYNFSVQKLVLVNFWLPGIPWLGPTLQIPMKLWRGSWHVSQTWIRADLWNRPNEWVIDQFVMEFATQNGDSFSAEHFEHASNPMWETATAAVCQHGQTSLRLARHTMVSGRTKIWPKLPPGRCLTKFAVCKLDFSRDNF